MAAAAFRRCRPPAVHDAHPRDPARRTREGSRWQLPAGERGARNLCRGGDTMRQAHPILYVAAAATLALGVGTAAHAQSITPPTVTHTMNVGETYTVNKSITLGPGGA